MGVVKEEKGEEGVVKGGAGRDRGCVEGKKREWRAY
jgi:hypothetical protein